jgi:hypothetical protein
MVEPYSNHKKTPEKKESIMDDITYGQWSKKHYNNDDDYDDHNNILNDEILDPYTMQKSFRKIAKKLSRRL